MADWGLVTESQAEKESAATVADDSERTQDPESTSTVPDAPPDGIVEDAGAPETTSNPKHTVRLKANTPNVPDIGDVFSPGQPAPPTRPEKPAPSVDLPPPPSADDAINSSPPSSEEATPSTNAPAPDSGSKTVADTAPSIASFDPGVTATFPAVASPSTPVPAVRATPPQPPTSVPLQPPAEAPPDIATTEQPPVAMASTEPTSDGTATKLVDQTAPTLLPPPVLDSALVDPTLDTPAESPGDGQPAETTPTSAGSPGPTPTQVAPSAEPTATADPDATVVVSVTDLADAAVADTTTVETAGAETAVIDAAIDETVELETAVADAAIIAPSSAPAGTTSSTDATAELPVVADVSPSGGSMDQATVVADSATRTQRLTPPTDEPGEATPPEQTAPEQASPATLTEVKPRRSKRPLLVVVTAIAAVILLVYAAWLFDLARTRGEVVRGTRLGSVPVGGFDEEALDALINQLNADLAGAELELRIGDATVISDPATLGAAIDAGSVKAQALDAGRDSNFITGPMTWLNTFFSEELIEPTYLVDGSVTDGAVEEIIATSLEQPREPMLSLLGGEFAVEPGGAGLRFEADEVTTLLLQELEGEAPYQLTLTPLSAEPRFSDEQIERVASEATEATTANVIFRVLDQTTELQPTDIRQWVELDASEGEPRWKIDEAAALEDLRPLFPVLGSEDQLARFSIVDGTPIIIPAAETVVCCSAASVAEIQQRLLEPPPPAPSNENDDSPSDEAPLRIIALEPEILSGDEGVAELESLGIIEEISTFTTMHSCCENRVINIQRFADLVTGAIIRPGENLSLNDYVGRRTTENGFVADGAIVDGILEPQVGGGVSQFATTFFNAAFYAGIDFNTYQSHSLYISRYPRGREATISFPAPDLSVRNTTEYGILIWPTYTATSITVTFYSTKHIEVEDLPLLRSSRNQCSVWTTPRVRTYPDGTVKNDSVFALYRPGVGLNCDGSSTRPEEPEAPTAVEPIGGVPPVEPPPSPGEQPPAPEPPADEPVA